jgi:hypothetical protein
MIAAFMPISSGVNSMLPLPLPLPAPAPITITS